MARRCLIISYYFPPVGGGGVQRMVKLIKFLSRKNWQFTVLTADNDIVSLPEDPTILDDIDNPVKIIKVPLTSNNNRIYSIIRSALPSKSGFIQRWLSAFLYIPDIRISWIKPLNRSVTDELKHQKYDCILITSPPYSLAVYAAQISQRTSIPVILDMRDPWTINPYKIHPTPYHYYKDRHLELESISHIEFGISAYQTLIDFYRKNISNFREDQWQVIPNGYDEEDFQDLNTDRLDNKCFNIAFSGTFYSHINNPRPLFKAISQLSPEMQHKLKFHHLGESQIDLPYLITKFKLQNRIKLWGYLPHKECIQLLNRMDAFCFILDDNNKNSSYTIGGKVYEYLRLKKPILAMVPVKGEAADLINATKSGKVISPHDTQGITAVLNNWINGDMKFDFEGIEIYEREKQARQFLNVINRACNTGTVSN
ncbi:MAG: glycosyltransferase [Calditrichaceae bacterium]